MSAAHTGSGAAARDPRPEGLRAVEGTRGGEPRKLGCRGEGPSWERRTGGGMRGPTRGGGCPDEQRNCLAASLGKL